MNNMVSIVTINYNNAAGLLKTIKSVQSQTYDNLEFIVIDGGSNDGSLSILEEHSSFIDVVISESDSGVYDAMNKGISLANGEWLNFMNSGDVFASHNVVDDIFTKAIDPKTRLLFGSQLKKGQIEPPLPIRYLKLGVINACHQAMFFRTPIIYNLSYSVYSDYDLVARIYKTDPTSISYVNSVVCEFEGGGISSLSSFGKIRDKYMSVFRNFGFISVFYAILYSLYTKVS